MSGFVWVRASREADIVSDSTFVISAYWMLCALALFTWYDNNYREPLRPMVALFMFMLSGLAPLFFLVLILVRPFGWFVIALLFNPVIWVLLFLWIF